MPTGSITQEQVDFVETWENVSPSVNFIVKLDVRGDEQYVQVSGSRSFTLTSHERLITQGKVVDPANDPFLNGCFRPVIVPKEVNIESNPNALSDDDIRNIFVVSEVAWSEWLDALTAPATLRRMMALAEDDEGIPHKRYNALKARLAEVTGGPKHATQKDEDTYKAMAGEAPPPSKPASRARKKAAMTTTTSSAQ